MRLRSLQAILLSCLALCAHNLCGQLTFVQDTLFIPPTTIDSSVVFSIEVANDLTIDQVATFAGIGAPLTLSQATLNVPASGSSSLDLSFNPVAVADYSDDLIVTGSVFGADTLHIVAEGTLPQGQLLTDTLHFGAVSVNSVSTQYIELASVGIGTLFISQILTSDPVITAPQGVSIPQGEIAQIPIEFFSEFSGEYAVDLIIYTSDPFNPVHYVHCTATAISEVSGNVCGTWSAVNSPYLLNADLLIPEGCTLVIEPGVLVDLNGFVMRAEGELDSQGDALNPVTILNGQVQLLQDTFNAVYTQFSNNASLNLVNRQTVYFDDFENGSQPFYCYSDNWGGNTSGNGNYHCDVFDNYQSDVWSSNGIRSLRFFSDNYNGTMQLDSPPNELESGLYQWSFLYRNELFERGVRLRAYYEINGGGLVQFYESPQDSYELEQEQFAGFSEFFEVPEGATVNIIFQHYIPSTSGCFDQARSYLDDIRLDKVEQLPVESLLFSNQATLGGSSTASSSGAAVVGASSAFGAVGTAIQLQTGIGQATSFWISRPIAVNSNRLFVDYWEKRTTADQNCWFYTHYRKNGGEWVLLRDQREIECGDGSMETHDWEKRNYIIEDLEFGDQVEFRLQIEAFDIGNPIYRDVTMLIDEFRIREDFSQPVAIEATGTQSIHLDHCAVSGDVIATSDSCTVQLDFSELEGLYIEGNFANVMADSSALRNIDLAYSEANCVLSRTLVENQTGNGIYLGTEAQLSLYDCTVQNCGGSGITVGSNSTVDVQYSFLMGNGGDGAELGLGSSIQANNSLVAYNLGFGINSAGSADIDYTVLRANGKQGLTTQLFSTVDNSILWFNDGVPQMTTDNVYAVSYSNVQGINALLTSSSFAWGDGCIGTDPVFADSLAYLDPFSPCVDGGKPWEQDAHIPFGLGSSRADMGLYGGPNNAFWGGEEPPNGSVQITGIFDIPDDQGGQVGLHFSASPFDFGGLGFNVTYYSIWRDLSLGTTDVINVSAGNWEEIGQVPAQGFAQYGYTAETLVNSSPDGSSCLSNFIVIAHTNDENIYWVSDVAAACSADNLAPQAPMLSGEVVYEGNQYFASLSWEAPEDADYAFTQLEGSNGFFTTVANDTAAVDPAFADLTTYQAIHFDTNGNASDTATVVLNQTGAFGPDLIPLVPGWNLISSDRNPENSSVASIFATLEPGNLEYATSFIGGVQFYDPNGLQFLNTLDFWESGHGYWVKVNAADTLQVAGTLLDPGYLPPYLNGWNLMGYAGFAPISPAELFSIPEEAGGTLDYVTGYSSGYQYFDPNGLPFLNTLTQVENGFGYWVKIEGIEPAENGIIGNDLTVESRTPQFDIVNGRIEGFQEEWSESCVEVLDESDAVVACLDILETGHLMTAGVFLDSDEPQELRFRLLGMVAQEKYVWSGNMRFIPLELHFTDGPSARCYPNPTAARTTLTLHLPSAGNVNAEIVNGLGQRVAVQQFHATQAGEQSIELDFSELPHHVYAVRIYLNSEFQESVQVVCGAE